MYKKVFLLTIFKHKSCYALIYVERFESFDSIFLSSFMRSKTSDQSSSELDFRLSAIDVDVKYEYEYQSNSDVFWHFNQSCLSILECPLWNCCAEHEIKLYLMTCQLQEIPECFGRLQLEQFFCPQGLEVLHPGSGHQNRSYISKRNFRVKLNLKKILNIKNKVFNNTCSSYNIEI